MSGEDDLVVLLRGKSELTEAQKEEQRRSFAYGNTKMSNEAITREMVDDVAEKLRRGDSLATDFQQVDDSQPR